MKTTKEIKKLLIESVKKMEESKYFKKYDGKLNPNNKNLQKEIKDNEMFANNETFNNILLNELSYCDFDISKLVSRLIESDKQNSLLDDYLHEAIFNCSSCEEETNIEDCTFRKNDYEYKVYCYDCENNEEEDDE